MENHERNRFTVTEQYKVHVSHGFARMYKASDHLDDVSNGTTDDTMQDLTCTKGCMMNCSPVIA